MRSVEANGKIAHFRQKSPLLLLALNLEEDPNLLQNKARVICCCCRCYKSCFHSLHMCPFILLVLGHDVGKCDYKQDVVQLCSKGSFTSILIIKLITSITFDNLNQHTEQNLY